jgi:hypothetical protein
MVVLHTYLAGVPRLPISTVMRGLDPRIHTSLPIRPHLRDPAAAVNLTIF